MWFSTENGLTSFDGTSVLYHNTAQQAKEYELNKITAFAEDLYHNFYIGDRTGLYYFNRKNKDFSAIKYVFENSPYSTNESPFINSIYVDNNNILFAGLGSRGLLIYNPATKLAENIEVDSSKEFHWANNNIRCIEPHFSDNSKLWLGTRNGIYLYDKTTKRVSKNFKVTNPVMGFSRKTTTLYDVQKMEVINDSVIWFNTWVSGFCEYKTNAGKVIVYLQREIPGLGTNIPISVTPSFVRFSENFFFIAAHNNHSSLFDIKSKRAVPVSITGGANAFDVVTFATKDKSGNLWLLRNGLFYTAIPKYGRVVTTDIHKQLTPSTIHNELKGVFYDSLSAEYYGAVRHSSGVYVFDSNFYLLRIIPTPLYTNNYTYKETCTDKITIDGSGRIWVTGHETYIKLPDQDKFDHIRKILPSLSWIETKGEFYDLITTKEGNILMRGQGTNVYYINHKTLKTDTLKFPRFSAAINFFIHSPNLLYDATNSIIYYMHNDGIVQHNLVTQKQREVAEANFLDRSSSGRPFIQLSVDDKSRVWAMQENYGIRILDPFTLQCIDSFSIGSRGLKLSYYSDIVYGGENYMFLQGQNGVVVYNYEKQQSFLFDNSNGLKYPDAYSLLYSNKHLVLGQSDAVQTYDTRLFEKNSFKLFPRINLISSDTLIVYDRERADSIRKITLKYFQNNLRISFSAPEFIFPERIEYAYQLSGFEDDWQYASYFKREVSYTRLRPGSYTFKLKAQMQGGNWNVEPVEYEIIVLEAWWQTNLFKIGMFMLILATIILVFRLRIQSIRRKERQKGKHEKELLELEAKALRAQMNPHFIFNCLNSIKTLMQENQNEKGVTYLITFSKLIRTLLNNADKKEISLYDEVETCKLYLQLEAMRFDAKFSYSVTIDTGIDLKSIVVPALLVQPFIENAIWHGIMPKAGEGNVLFNVSKKNDSIEISVEDDGIGRVASMQNKPASNIGHQSKGVNLTQARLELDNLLQQRQVTLVTIDKTDENGGGTGTIVIIKIKEEG